MSEIKTEGDTSVQWLNTLSANLASLGHVEAAADVAAASLLVKDNAELKNRARTLKRENAELYQKLLFAEDASQKGEEGRKLGTAFEELQKEFQTALALLNRMAVNDKSFPSSSTCKCVTCVLHAEVEQFLSSNAPNNPRKD
jgi:hypothetical protein